MATIASTSRSTKIRSKWRKKKSLARSRGRGWATRDLERKRWRGARTSNWGKRRAGAIGGPQFVLREPLPSPPSRFPPQDDVPRNRRRRAPEGRDRRGTARECARGRGGGNGV